jgi:hypothetical protein
MRRLAVTALICALCTGVAGASLGAPVVARNKAVVRVKACSLADHTAVFYARMRKVRGTRRMKLKFTLLERPAGLRRFLRVKAPGLTRWHRSALRVKAYGYSQEVRGLHDGSAYRMRVRYRWYGDHKLLRSARRTSRICRMFVPLPNLRVQILGATAGTPWHYTARVSNVGEAPADDVAVQLRVKGGEVDTKTISHIDAGASVDEPFDGPSCQGGRFAFIVDPTGTIAESNEADNRASHACPAG